MYELRQQSSHVNGESNGEWGKFVIPPVSPASEESHGRSLFILELSFMNENGSQSRTKEKSYQLFTFRWEMRCDIRSRTRIGLTVQFIIIIIVVVINLRRKLGFYGA
jgi:hypothetical protein